MLRDPEVLRGSWASLGSHIKTAAELAYQPHVFASFSIMCTTPILHERKFSHPAQGRPNLLTKGLIKLGMCCASSKIIFFSKGEVLDAISPACERSIYY